MDYYSVLDTVTTCSSVGGSCPQPQLTRGHSPALLDLVRSKANTVPHCLITDPFMKLEKLSLPSPTMKLPSCSFLDLETGVWDDVPLTSSQTSMNLRFSTK